MVLDETKVGHGFGDAVPCANFHSDMLPTLYLLKLHGEFLISLGTKGRGGCAAEDAKVEALKCRSYFFNFLAM